MAGIDIFKCHMVCRVPTNLNRLEPNYVRVTTYCEPAVEAIHLSICFRAHCSNQICKRIAILRTMCTQLVSWTLHKDSLASFRSSNWAIILWLCTNTSAMFAICSDPWVLVDCLMNKESFNHCYCSVYWSLCGGDHHVCQCKRERWLRSGVGV